MSSSSIDARQLRSFGLIMATAFGLVLGLAVPWLLERPPQRWLWWVAAAFAGPAIACPRVLLPAHGAWMRLGHAMGQVSSRALLGVAYLSVLLPMALLMRVARRAPLRHGYRVARAPRPPSHMERPY